MSAVDPWVITQKERFKYTEQFNTLQPVNGIVTGAQAKGFLLQSQLPPLVLGQIWALADTDSDGRMNVNEFSIACKLINLKLRGFEVPKVLPPSLLMSLASVGGTPTRTPTGAMSPASVGPPPVPPQPAILQQQQHQQQQQIHAAPQRPTIPPQPVLAQQPVVAAVPPPIPPQPSILPQTIGIAPTVAPMTAAQPNLISMNNVTAMTGVVPPMQPPQQQSIPGYVMPPAPQQQTTVAYTSQPTAVVKPMEANLLDSSASSLIGGIGAVPQQTVVPTSMMPGMIPGQLPGQLPTQIAGQIPTAQIPGQIPVGQFTAAPVAAMQPLVGGIAATAAPQMPMTASAIPGVYPGQTAVIPPMSAVAAPIATAVPAPPTPPSGTQSRSMSISGDIGRAPSIDSPGAGVEWAIKGPAKLKYTQLFNSIDKTRSGFLTGAQARGILMQSKLPQMTLAQIWSLADMDQDGRLGCEEFVLAMYLCDLGLQGEKIPAVLPLELIPPSFRNKVGSKTVSRTGSVAGSRHGSVSSQGAVDMDPTAGLPQSSFEDKRKENFDKGQAELDRRRRIIEDQQRKEREALERKEREEADKREKARLEAEMKKQQEIEAELQRQRELEQEREEQRLRELEKKELARKELEKQRQEEWVKQKLSEMEIQREKEQQKLLQLKAQSQSLGIELTTLNEKVKEVTQKICDTRGNVTKVKTSIDGMRSTRDKTMQEMQALKQKIKDQNQRLIQLSQEKAKLDAKSKVKDPAAAEQMQAQFTSKQLLIKQLKDKMHDLKEVLEAKKKDMEGQDIEIAEMKTKLGELIIECETLYNEYDEKRIQVLELKHNRKNESLTSAWDTAPTTSAWGDEPVAVAATAVTSSMAAVDTSVAPPGYVKYRAIFEFSARNADEITFQPGDIIMVPLEQNAEPGWLAGEINGHTGWFPETYVEKVDSPTSAAASSAAFEQDAFADNNQFDNAGFNEAAFEPEPAAIQPTTVAADAVDGEYYISVYPYNSAEPGDLIFDAGETIIITHKDGDWWTGTVAGTTRTGIFPSNYVQPLDSVGTNGTSAVSSEPISEPIAAEVVQKQEAPQSPYGGDSNQADVDSEVSQINTQSQQVTDSGQHEFKRSTSRSSSSASQRLGRLKGEVAQAIASYEATSAEQLSLAKGQLVMVRKKTDSGWWEGELQQKGRRKQVGWFPATYVKILQSGRISGRTTPVSMSSKIEYNETIIDKVIALYPYKAINDDELSFEKDDIISVLGKDEPEWWRGELNGIVGLFPSNYVGKFGNL